MFRESMIKQLNMSISEVDNVLIFLTKRGYISIPSFEYNKSKLVVEENINQNDYFKEMKKMEVFSEIITLNKSSILRVFNYIKDNNTGYILKDHIIFL